MWADGSFRTRTIHVLDDYVRRLLPLPSMPQMILLGTYAGPLHLINAISGEIEVTYEGQPTETTCLDCDGDVVAAGCSGSVRVWDAWTGEELAVVAGHSRGVVGVKIMDLAGSDLEGWDAAVSFDAGDSGVVASRMALVTRAARTKVVYSAGLDGVVLAHRITLPPRPPHGAATPSPPCYDPDRDTKRLDLPTLNGRLTSFLCSADLLVLGTSNGSIHVIRVPLASFPPLPPSAPETAIQGAHGGPVRSLRRDPARGILASGGDDCRLRLWSLALPAGPAAPSIDPVRSFRAHNHGTVMSIDLDLARGRLSTGGTDGAVKVWLVGDDLMRDDGWIIWRHTACGFPRLGRLWMSCWRC
ncbi:WD40-repeat-containing domain protein [Hyaloraphidium curvatum]|nr:WD40-repeat-containing domain protein [Hyaloraphidium curvatum]